MNQPRESRTITPEIEQQAQEWLSVIQSDQASPRERQQFMAWLDADARHCAAYSEVAALWGDIAELSHLRQLEQPGIEPVRREGSMPGGLLGWRSWFVWGGLGATVAAALVLFVIVLPQSGQRAPVPRTTAEYTTDIGEIRQITLNDGSTLVLGAQSAASITYGENRRGVTLSTGEAFFAVTKDAFRPFVVTAGNTQVTVTGTQFDVRYGVDTIRIGVAEGRVEVAATESPDSRRALKAGDKLVASKAGDLAPTQTIAAEQVGAWRQGRLIYDMAPLRELIADARRYYPAPITLADSRLGGLSVTAAFRTDDIPQMLNSLAVTHAVDIAWGDDGSALIKEKPHFLK